MPIFDHIAHSLELRCAVCGAPVEYAVVRGAVRQIMDCEVRCYRPECQQTPIQYPASFLARVPRNEP